MTALSSTSASSSNYYCVADEDKCDLWKALIAKKAELEKELDNEEDEEDEEDYDWFLEEGSDDNEAGS